MADRNIFVLGGSAGSGPALKRLVRALPRDFPGSLFITTHMPSTHPSHLKEMLQGEGGLQVVRALDGMPIEPARAYVATPDRHLLILDGAIRLGAGPRENLVRPSIDPMFRSAALSHGPRVVGVVVSGLLNDGASGLHAIKSVGGTVIVQDPREAAEDEMPRAALEAVEADHVADIEGIAALMPQIARSPAGLAIAPAASLLFEVEVALGARLGSEALLRFADPAPLSCPDCGGVLSEVRGQSPLRFRCQIGHAYTAEQLAAKHDLVDEAVRIAMRMMEERVSLVERMARAARETGRSAVAELYESRAREYDRYAATLREAAISSLAVGYGPDDRT